MRDKRSKGGCLRIIFMLLNAIFLLLGLGLLGYMIWILATLAEMNRVLAGSAIFTYLVLSLAGFICLTGGIGCCASFKANTCCLKLYILLMVLFLLAEIGGLIYLLVQTDQKGTFLKHAWLDLNQDTKNIIQTKLQCCGYNGTHEYTVKNQSLDDSCYNRTTKGSSFVHSKPCSEAILSWFQNNVPIWAATLGVLALLEILSLLTSGIVVKKINKSKKYYEDQELQQPTHSRMENYDTDDEYPDVTYRGNDQSLLENESRPPPYNHPGRGYHEPETRPPNHPGRGYDEPETRPPSENPYHSTSLNY